MVTDQRSILGASSGILSPSSFSSSSSAMSPPLRPSSPPATSAAANGMSPTTSSAARQRPRPSANNPASSFHLGNLPRFHPAVYQYQSSHAGPNTPSHPPSPVQQRPSSQSHRVQPRGSRDNMRQYRDLASRVPVAFTTTTTTSSAAAAAASTSSSSSSAASSYTRPAKPRLDPLGSPGPVTPLALEEDGEDGYLGVHRSSDGATKAANGGPARSSTSDPIEQLIQRENERIASQNRARKDNKGR